MCIKQKKALPQGYVSNKKETISISMMSSLLYKRISSNFSRFDNKKKGAILVNLSLHWRNAEWCDVWRRMRDYIPSSTYSSLSLSFLLSLPRGFDIIIVVSLRQLDFMKNCVQHVRIWDTRNWHLSSLDLLIDWQCQKYI